MSAVLALAMLENGVEPLSLNTLGNTEFDPLPWYSQSAKKCIQNMLDRAHELNLGIASDRAILDCLRMVQAQSKFLLGEEVYLATRGLAIAGNAMGTQALNSVST